MAREENRLSARTVATVGPGWHADGRNLHLRVDGSRRRWIVKIVRNGRKTEYGVGSVDTTSVALARKKRDQILAQLADGLDPAEEKRKARAAGSVKRQTFGEVAAAVLAKNAAGWKRSSEGRESTREGWTRSFQVDCKPIAGMPVDQIATRDVVRVLAPLWDSGKHETVRRLLPRIRAVLDFAEAHGLRQGDNPARSSLIKHIAPNQPNGGAKRHAAMDWRDMPAFMVRLRAVDTMAALCLELLILTATRSGETRGARWSEVDFEAAIWTIPPTRMKTTNGHTVPLSAQALDLLRRVETI